MTKFHSDAIFWVDVEKIKPNPYQPRREFDAGKLQDLSDSIRQYGVLQPLVVTRKEVYTQDGGMQTEYELIAGERRLRASKLAQVGQVPVVIRSDEEDDNVKLELAIIENIQREDLNPIDRARAFARLANEFKYKHGEIGKKMGRSREYVSNSIRLLSLPEEMLQALAEGRMKEGHTRPLLMLSDKPEEQQVLFREIILKKINVREAEQISRRAAHERARRHDVISRPDILEFEKQVGEKLGTRVHVHKHAGSESGKVVINFASEEDLTKLMEEFKGRFSEEEKRRREEESQQVAVGTQTEESQPETVPKEKEEEDDTIYSLENFSL